jgi:uncharacterized protein
LAGREYNGRMDLKDKVIVITGASSGLGKALAVAFVSRGAKVVMSSNNEMELQAAAQEVGGVPVVADVTKEADMQKLADAAVAQFGRIDIWVNNAGIWIPWALVEEMDGEQVRRMLEVNLLGTIFGSRIAITQMKKQGEGTILNVISTSGLEPRLRSACYAATKWGATGFTKSIRLETEPGVRVFGAYPGGMKTDIFGDHRPPDYDTYMEPSFVAEKIVGNLEKDSPEDDLVITST